MNCIILLLLLSCCGGWGNGYGMSGDNGICPRENGRNGQGRCGDGCARREPDRGRPGRRSEDCGCREERREREERDCGCRQEEREGREMPGMIPPPWQEYPKFPRRDNGEDCES